MQHENSLDNAFIELTDALQRIDDITPPSPSEAAEFIRNLNDAPEEEQIEHYKQCAIIFIGTLTTLANYLALMVHGRTLCRLVSDAKNGDDDAFCRAVQTDRTVLNLSFFRDRMISAQLCGDQPFLRCRHGSGQAGMYRPTD